MALMRRRKKQSRIPPTPSTIKRVRVENGAGRLHAGASGPAATEPAGPPAGRKRSDSPRLPSVVAGVPGAAGSVRGEIGKSGAESVFIGTFSSHLETVTNGVACLRRCIAKSRQHLNQFLLSRRRLACGRGGRREHQLAL